MDIKRVALDAVNETIVITVVHMDYKVKYKRINEKKCLWRPLKGLERAVPKDLVEKQYGKAIIEEVTKVVDLALERFLIRKIKPLAS
jgi:trigger factor